MKRLIPILLSFLMLFSLAACAGQPKETTPAAEEKPITAEPVPEEPVEDEPTGEIPAEVPAAEDAQPLIDLLYQITDRVEPGASGSSLKAALMAADLLDWGETTPLSAEQIAAVVNTEFYDKMSEEQQNAFLEAIPALDEAITQLQEDGAPQLLETCGYTGTGYPWSEAAVQNVMAIGSFCRN